MIARFGGPWKSRLLFRLLLPALALVMALAVLEGAPDPATGQVPDPPKAKYQFRIMGNFVAGALASGVSVPSGASFSPLVGGVHDADMTIWAEGEAASTHLEGLAEDGASPQFFSWIRDHSGAFDEFKLNPALTWVDLGPTQGRNTTATLVDASHSLVTAMAQIKPSPDWFVGVSGFDLRPNGVWITEQTVDLYAWDAGTDDGTDFTSADADTTSQETITSLRNTGKFSDTPIARLTIKLKPPPRGVDKMGGTVSAAAGAGSATLTWTPISDIIVDGYKVQWKSGAETFEEAEADGREALVMGQNASEHTITELTSDVEYTVRVMPFNGAGDGPVHAATLTATPSDISAAFGQASYTVTEGAGSVTVTVTLSADPERTVTIPLTVTGQGGATSADYAGLPQAVTFESGDTSSTFKIRAPGDTDSDSGESIKLGFTLPEGILAGTTDETTVNITDASYDTLVTFDASSYSVDEGDDLTVTVNLSEAPANAVTIPLTTRKHGGATNSDYTVPANVMFAANETSQTFTFTADQDDDDDDGESVRVTFGTLPSGVGAGSPGEATVAIDDDDVVVPDVAVTLRTADGQSDIVIDEGDTVTLVATLSRDPERTFTLRLSHFHNSSTATIADYSVVRNVTFNSGDLEQRFDFTASTDVLEEDQEWIRIELPLGNLPPGVTTPLPHNVDIRINDDPPLKVRFPDASYTVAEGSSVDVKVKLSEDPGETVTIPLTIMNQGTATSADYSGVPSSVTFNSGETTKTFSFTAAGDTVTDPGESVKIALGTLPSPVIAGNQVETTVNITDSAGLAVSFEQATYSVAEGSSVQVKVKLSGAPGQSVSIPLTATHEGTATNADYSGVPGSVTFNSTQTEKTFAFNATQDVIDDDDEKVKIAFGTLPAGFTEGSTADATVTIVDDDTRGLVVRHVSEFPEPLVDEGGTADLTIRLATRPTDTVTVAVSTSDSVVATVSPASLTFTTSNWSTPRTVTVTGEQEADIENHLLKLNFVASGGDYEGETHEQDVRVLDDDAPATELNFKATGETRNIVFGAIQAVGPVYAAPEGESVDVFVTLSAAPGREIEIWMNTLRMGGATEDDYDHANLPTRITFGATETEQSFTFTTTQDTVDDDNEWLMASFLLAHLQPAGVTLGDSWAAALEIDDDEGPAVTVSFEQAGYTVAEGSTVTVKVKLSEDPGRTVTIPLTTANQNDASNTDYSGVPTSVTFNSGETEQTFDVTAVQDTIDDDGESVKLGFGTPPSGVAASGTTEATVSITDDDDPPVTVSFEQGSYTVAESDDTSTVGVEEHKVTIKVKLSADPERTVTIPLTETRDGATSGDYSGVPANVTFNTGDLEKSFTFTAGADSVDDDDESVTLGFDTTNVSWPAGVTTGTTDEATVSITDDDDPALTVSFEQDSYAVAEGSTVTVKVKLSVDPERTVTIPLTKTEQDGATSGDYSGVPANVTFNSGQTEQTFDVTAAQDTVDDDGESVKLGFDTTDASWPAGVTTGTTDEATVSITDDDVPAVEVSFEQDSYTVTEGAMVTVKVKLSADPERTVAILLTKTNQGDASSGDYSVPASVTFNSGDMEKSLTFTATDDSVDDDGESVKLGFDTADASWPAGVTTGTTDEATVSITDDDDPQVVVTLSPATATVAEDNTVVGDNTVTVTVSLDKDPERTVAIPLTAAGQDGAGTGDFSGVPASVTFNSGDTSRTFDFVATDDTVDDDGESVKITFGTVLPAGVSAGTANETVVTITDDDDPAVVVTLSPATATVIEGNTVTVTVSLDKAPERTVAIPLTAAGQDGADTGDFSGVPASVTFNSGDTSKTFDFMATDDTVDDDGESVKITFGTTLPAGVSAGTANETVVSITDNDDPAVKVSFEQASYTVAEGSNVTVKVKLDAAPERTVVIPIAKTDQDDASEADYSGVPSSVTFNSSDREQTFAFQAASDDVDDDGESVKLEFGSLPPGVSADDTDEATVNITDDPNDVPDVTVSFEQASYTVAEGSMVTVKVTLSAQPERSLSINLTKADQGGAGSGDYSGVPGSVMFATTETEQSFTFTASDDTSDDDDESVKLGFSSSLPAGVTAVSPSEATVSITDDPDDVPDVTVTFDSDSHTAAEGGSVTITVSLSPAPEREVVIPITKTDQGGASAADYSGVPASLTFDATDTSRQITFNATDDAVNDDGESVKLSFGTPPDGVTAGTPSETTVTLTDDDVPDVTVSFKQATYSVDEGLTVSVEVELSADPERSVSIPLTTTDQDGAVGDDYSGVPATVSFVSGQIMADFTFSAESDDDDDDGESVKLGFGTPPTGVTAGSTSEATVSINDDPADVPDVTVKFELATDDVDEGDDLDVKLILSVAPERLVTIPLTATLLDGATGPDYTIVSDVTFAADETEQMFTFSAEEDDLDDDGERVSIAFGTLPQDVSAETPSSTIIAINDDDDPEITVSFGADSYMVAEGSEVEITVSLNADPERLLTIPLDVSDSTAAIDDYSGVPANLTFTSGGALSQTITITAIDDTEDDDEDEVIVSVDTSGDDRLSAGVIGQTTISITDDDDPQVTVQFGAEDYTAIEGGNVTVTVTLSADPERSVTVPLVITPNGDISEGDYSGVPANVTFNSGEISMEFAVQAATDDEDDDDESLTLGFGPLPDGVTPGVQATTEVEIADGNVPAVTVQFDVAEYPVDEGAQVVVTVTLSEAPERGVTVPLRASFDGADADDFTAALPTSLAFGEADTQQTLTIETTQDDVDDDDESVTFSFGTLPTLVTAGSPAEATVAINDDDDPEVTVSFEQAEYTIPEGSFENIKVVLSEDPERDVQITLTLATEADGATDADYALDPPMNPFTFTIEGGQTDYTFTFRSTPDNEEDDGETVTISIDTPLPERVTAGDHIEAVVTIKPLPASGFAGAFGGGGGPSGPTPSEADFEWNVKRDIPQLDTTNDWPTDLWSDGKTLWVAENGQGSDDRVYAYDLESGERVEDYEFPLAETNRAPRGLWSDGTTAWIADSGQDRLFAYDLATGERVEALEIVLDGRNRDARAIWSDGTTMMVLDGGKNSLFVYDFATKDLLGEYVLDPSNDDPQGLWSDGDVYCVSDHVAKRIFAYQMPASEDETALVRIRREEFTLLPQAGNNSPRGIWSDGDVMYVADESDGRVYSYNMPDAVDARLASLSLSGVDFGEFDSGKTEYEGVAAGGATETTVEAETVQDGATVVIGPPDADDEAEGHQAVVGGAEIVVTVTSVDGSRTRAYRVQVSGAGAPASCLRGAVTVGFSLVVYEGGSVESLEACVESRHVTAMYALHEGEYAPYILGAPEFVNGPFLDLYPAGIPALTPLTVRSEGPATAATAAADFTQPWPDCLRGEIGEGFSLVLYEGGNVDDLEECTQFRDVAALYALHEGEYLPYILGAPEFVNEPFRVLFADGLPPATPLVAKR